MQFLINEFGTPITIIIIAIILVIVYYILFNIIKSAVNAGTRDQKELLEKQNELLSKMLKKD